jgi:hypothetical protein
MKIPALRLRALDRHSIDIGALIAHRLRGVFRLLSGGHCRH